MGGILQRSTTDRDELGAKGRRNKRPRQTDPQSWETVFDHNDFFKSMDDENQDPQMEFRQQYEPWLDAYEQNPAARISTNHEDSPNFEKTFFPSDPPGAPRSYASNYSLNQHDMVFPPSPPSQEQRQPFHPNNIRQPIPSTRVHNNPNQGRPSALVRPAADPSPKVKPYERSPKKVHFASPPTEQKQQHASQPSLNKPLQNTRSWGAPQQPAHNAPAPGVNIPVRLSVRPSAPQSQPQRPVYVGIDHQATLAERSRNVSAKRHRKATENDHPENLNYSTVQQQSRAQFSHQAKHRKPADSPRSDNELTQGLYLHTNQPPVTHNYRPITKSTSASRVPQHADQITPAFNNIRPVRSSRTRRQQVSMSTDANTLLPQENYPPLSHGSILTLQTETRRRRIEHSHSNSSVLRIPISRVNRQSQQQHAIVPTAIPNTHVTRVRV